MFWSRNPAVPTPRRRRASAWRGEMGGEWNSLLNETASPCPIGHSFRKNSFFVREGKTPIPCEARRAAPGRRPFASLRNGMRRRTCPPTPSPNRPPQSPPPPRPGAPPTASRWWEEDQKTDAHIVRPSRTKPRGTDPRRSQSDRNLASQYYGRNDWFLTNYDCNDFGRTGHGKWGQTPHLQRRTADEKGVWRRTLALDAPVGRRDGDGRRRRG